MRFSTFKRKQRINKYQIVKAFAGLLVNKTSLDDLLWGLTEAIGKLLYFPDCVIYLREGDEFVQKAATGLKNPDRRQIKNPLRLRLGQGIVGSVAKSGVPERIPDVTKDPRYVYDEAPAQSELTVPIIYDDEVIAIFDCESTERNFFSDADLDLFEVLANLMGPRIGLALEEQRRDKAEKELRAAKNAAEAANEAKSQFLANISHELRTPMTPIISYTELLINAEQSNSTPPVSESEALQAIQRNSELLLRLIDDVLDVAKIEAGELDVHISEFNLADLLDHIVTHQRIQAQVKNLELTVNYADNAPKIIYSDPLRVQQIVTNLIANAIKFTAAGGVKVNVDSPTARTMRVQVIDTGIGISEKELNGLFQPFTQVDPSSTRKYGGAGLGLFISRELASRLGGEIQVATELGKGSTFTLLLNSDHHITQDSSAPASLEEKAAKSNKQASIFLPYNYRILVAEDTKDTQFLVRTILESVGANVTLVENGKDAVEKVLSSIAAGQEYDAVLMDINMPLLDGYAATRKLREQRYAGLIIALTAHARPEDKEKCMAAGCDDYLSKPIKLNELVKLLRKHVYE